MSPARTSGELMIIDMAKGNTSKGTEKPKKTATKMNNTPSRELMHEPLQVILLPW